MFWVALVNTEISPQDAEDYVRNEGAGAVVSFIGTVRNHHGGRAVTKLEYEAHESLALKTMLRLANDASRTHGLLKAALVHRIGHVPIGQVCVVIAVSAAHRAAAFDGCRELIERLKVEVPIWKKESYADEAPAEWISS